MCGLWRLFATSCSEFLLCLFSLSIGQAGVGEGEIEALLADGAKEGKNVGSVSNMCLERERNKFLTPFFSRFGGGPRKLFPSSRTNTILQTIAKSPSPLRKALWPSGSVEHRKRDGIARMGNFLITKPLSFAFLASAATVKKAL